MNTIKEEMKSYWSSRAEAWKIARIRELHSPKRELWSAELNRYLPDGKGLNILDIGTGTGFFTFLLTEAGHRVTGIDLTEDMIAKADATAAELDLPANFRVMDAECPDFPDASFDALVCRNLTWTLPHLEMAYREWHRILRPDGVLIVFDADYDHVQESYIGCDPKGWVHNGLSRETWDQYLHMKEELAQLQNPRPAWDEALLTKTGFRDITSDSHLSERIYAVQDEFYNPTPMFTVAAKK